MKVLHIIPGAFHYFDDIKAEAFGIMEALGKWGVECESSTLTYGTWTKSEEAGVETAAPGLQFQSMGTVAETLASANQFDVVHLHVPLLGSASDILLWRKNNPAKPLVITFYRRVQTQTIFSFFIRWYNNYYLPKLFTLADAVTCHNAERFEKDSRQFIKNNVNYLVVDSSAYFVGQSVTFPASFASLTPGEAIAYKYSLLYTTLTDK